MQRLLATAAAVALLACGSAALAQDSSTSAANAGANAQQGQVASANNGGNSNGPQTTTVGPQTTTSNANSTSDAQQLQSLINGGSSANNGGVQVGPDTSNSNSNSNATTNSRSVATGGQGGASTANASNAASNAGNAQNITFNSPATPTHTTTDVRSAPTVYAPALATTLTETCMGSTSGGGSGMGWGFTLGSTWVDKACTRRLNADRVAGLFGDREAARAILCGDKDIYEAFEHVGRPCPQSPNYHPDQQAFYPLTPPPPPPPPPPPEPQPLAAPSPPPPPPVYVVMAPIPNPPETPRPVRHDRRRPYHHHPRVLACPARPLVCPKA